MDKNLGAFRKNYIKGELLESEIPEDPYLLFLDWFKEMESRKDPAEINIMSLATIGADGFPKNRIVLLKEFNPEGFVFYTNYTSEKGQSLIDNPKTCLSFFWPFLERQVIIKGMAEKVSEEKAIEYFRSRPRGSQLGAWASRQSTEIDSREVLENKLLELDLKFKDKEVPKPAFWGGFLIRPLSYEFWQGRANRLHDRIIYNLHEGSWDKKRLAP